MSGLLARKRGGPLLFCMKRRDPVVEALDTLAELRRGGEDSTRRIGEFLWNRSNLVVAKAAKVAGELRIEALVPNLAAAFERLMADPAKLDKGCAAATAIVEALYVMDYDQSDVYLRGGRHVQMEGSFGPPVDAAAQLRGDCALGLVRTRHPDALFEVVRLLADKEPQARIGAARALGLAGETGELVLLLKTLTGDRELDVVATTVSLRRHYPVKFERSVTLRPVLASHPLSPVHPSSRLDQSEIYHGVSPFN